MLNISRRQFSSALLVLGAQPRRIWGATAGNISDTLHSALDQHKIPAGGRDGRDVHEVTYTGAFGTRDSTSGIAVTPESIFMIASMTKPVTSVAAMQLVEQGKLKLDEPASSLHSRSSAGCRCCTGSTRPVNPF